MNTPVIIPAQAFEMSQLIARRAPSASLSATLTGGSSCIRRPPTWRLMLDTSNTSRSSAPQSAYAKASRAAPSASV
jgi:hypothetical protein